mgnify:CR=1 FL=1
MAGRELDELELARQGALGASLLDDDPRLVREEGAIRAAPELLHMGEVAVDEEGDAIGGVNLRSGKFRNAVIDRDLDRFIRAGSPAGMPAFNLDASEMAGIIAYLRNMYAFDGAAVKTGNIARGQTIFASGTLAYEALPADLKARVDELWTWLTALPQLPPEHQFGS